MIPIAVSKVYSASQLPEEAVEAPAEVAGGTCGAGSVVLQFLLAQPLQVRPKRTLRLAVHQAQQVVQPVRFPAPINGASGWQQRIAAQ